LGYLTLRMDRGRKGEKISMLDMCQLTNRLTEHKYITIADSCDAP